MLLSLRRNNDLKYNKRYNKKPREVLSNQQLKAPYPSEEQRVFRFYFSIFSIV